MQPSTPRYIVLIVISTLALLSCVYVFTLAWTVISGNTVQAEPMREFSTVGTLIIGALVGVLANTRSGPPEPIKTESVTTTETKQTAGGQDGDSA